MSGRPREFDDNAVIEAAMDVFWSNGYEGTSTETLCEQTGLGRGSLYNAFGSKQKLYELALRRYQELGIETQAGILNGPGTIKERLRTLMQWGIEGDLGPSRGRGCMALFAALDRAGKDPIVAEISRIYVSRLEQVVCHLFAVGQRNGEVSTECSALEMARTFLSSYYGLRVLGQSMPDRGFLEDVMKGTLARL
ncbi:MULTISPECIES: TetR/AcrR family transcriptional regulator [Pseudomonas]|jgi:AcrR family transcriptional regulator|uniref:TetR/AcrR family transcriptional regulator n=1 Tax=Pseudomonas sp. Hg7Tf TaxID=3236988 RepID=A0AB39I395_9PSED|nr:MULTISPECIES: TetR/AcrR family transcriptional regulator [Pseudomonas]MDD1976065.1 TetR/AcrR family transcriptional regulator [Pseudomonas putida]MDH2561978.1 TetR/AcrR family transcriptional regulator [Pseudomonas sp. Hg5Tf]QYX49115.1 TetR/AcrR family transcriptional regulator [Pseudomonas sp. S11A 273]